MELIDHNWYTKGVSIISQIIALTSFAALVDSLAKPKDRDIIAGFISKGSSIKFKQFEHSIIKSAINVFCSKEGNLNPIRVLFYSLVGAFVFTIVIVLGRWGMPVFGSDINYSPEYWQKALQILLIAPLIAYMSYPSDVVSLYITKKIFLRAERKVIYLPFYWFLDVFLSTLFTITPIALMYFISLSLINTVFAAGALKYTLFPLIGSTVVSALLSLFVSIFQFSVIAFGFVARGTIGPLLAYVNLFRGALNFENYPIAVTCFSFTTLSGLLKYSIFYFFGN